MTKKLLEEIKREIREVRGNLRFDIIQHVKSKYNYIIFVTAIFYLAMLTGYCLSTADSHLQQQTIDTLKSSFSDIPEDGIGKMIGIFLNNCRVNFMVSYFGVIAGIPSILPMGLNGFMLGVVLLKTIQVYGFQGAPLFIAGIGPHGIIELPAMFISAGMGLSIGYNTIKKMIKRNPNYRLIPEMTRMVVTYTVLIVPALFIAAVIEAYITPVIMEIVMGI